MYVYMHIIGLKKNSSPSRDHNPWFIIVNKKQRWSMHMPNSKWNKQVLSMWKGLKNIKRKRENKKLVIKNLRLIVAVFV